MKPAKTVPVLCLAAFAGTVGRSYALHETPQPDSSQTTSRNDVALDGTAGDLQIPRDRLRWHIPDRDAATQEAAKRQKQARQNGKSALVANIERYIDRISQISRPQRVRLSLEDALRRSLANSYDIEVSRYGPAIEATRVVEAEAAFDAVFFSNISNNKVDRPTGSQLVSGDQVDFNSSFGIRKLLPSGMRVSGRYALSRTKSTLSFQVINPAYFSSIILEMQQPLLRGFGVDYNRSVIRLRQNDLRGSRLQLHRRARDTLREVEEAYWRVVQARRDIVITARLLADFEMIYDYLLARQEFDATPVQLAATRADLEESRFDFISRRAALFDAEDRLIFAMNDPEINLADNLEIIPTDLPNLDRIVVDRLAEVQTALDNRPEINEQELQVASAKIFLDRAKNEELPRLDVTFRYTIDGLAGTADRSFDEVTGHNFVEYFVGVELEIPIGNRGPRAARHRARLQHAQAIAQLRSVIEQTIRDVSFTTRALSTAFDQITPSFHSAEAREREVDSIVARAERKDFNTLTTELNSRQRLAGARRAMLAAMIDCNIAVIDLERAKGTLLRYNNVVIAPAEE